MFYVFKHVGATNRKGEFCLSVSVSKKIFFEANID